MKVFGITGGIGSGKSTVAELVRQEGIPVVDADLLAREAVAPGGPGLSKVVEEFGISAIGKDGHLDRKMMGALAFSRPSARERLNAILHPMVRELAKRKFAEIESHGYALAAYDVPLLFESGIQVEYRPVVVVFAEEEDQVRRVMARNSLLEKEARLRIGAQMPLAKKACMADIVVDNRWGIDELRVRVKDMIQQVHALV